MNLNVKDVFIRFSLESGGISYKLFIEYDKEKKIPLFQVSGLSLKDIEIVKEICTNRSKAILYKKEAKHSSLCKFIIENYNEKKIRIDNEEEILIPIWDNNNNITTGTNLFTTRSTTGHVSIFKDTFDRLSSLGI